MKKKNPYQAHFFNIKQWFFDFARFSGFPMLLWFRVKKVFLNKKDKKHIKGGALIICNHILYSDPMVLSCGFWYRRVHFLVMKEMFVNKFVGWIYGHSGCIPVDREKPSLKTIREVVQRLEGGNVVTIFPEGHVSFSNDNPMSNFKSGAVLMAYQANVPIVPIYREIRSNIFKRQKLLIGEKIDIRKQFGENLSMEKIEEITKYLFEKEKELRGIYKERKL